MATKKVCKAFYDVCCEYGKDITLVADEGKTVIIDVPSDDYYKATWNEVRDEVNARTGYQKKEEKKMGYTLTDAQTGKLIDFALLHLGTTAPAAPVAAPASSAAPIVTIPADYEQLKKELEAVKKDLEKARATAATWQSNHAKLENEFKAYRISHPDTPVAASAPADPAPADPAPADPAPVVAPATPTPATPAPAAPEHKSFDDMFPGYEYVPFVIDENHALAHNPLYQKRGFEFSTWHEMIKSKYAHRKEYAKVIQAFDFKRVTGMINDPIHINFLANDLTGKIIAEVVAHYNDKGTKNAQDGKVYSLFTPEYLNGIVALYNRYIDAYAPAATATSAPVATAASDSPFDLDSFEVE